LSQRQLSRKGKQNREEGTEIKGGENRRERSRKKTAKRKIRKTQER
jgi:hypothetical protein